MSSASLESSSTEARCSTFVGEMFALGCHSAYYGCGPHHPVTFGQTLARPWYKTFGGLHALAPGLFSPQDPLLARDLRAMVGRALMKLETVLNFRSRAAPALCVNLF